MASIVGPLRGRYVGPWDDVLSGFNCGTGTKPEKEVNKLVADFHAGRKSQCEMRVVEEGPTGALVGVCCFRRLLLGKALLPDADWDALYIAVIGLSKPFRGCRLLADGSSMGDVVLCDSLGEIKMRWGEQQMPAVTAMVSPRNKPSWNLFTRHGFEEWIKGRGTGDAWLRRPIGLDLAG